MNTPVTLDPASQTDDLVLRFVGGKKDGESVSVNTACCKLDVSRRTAKNESVNDECSIYRGPAGAAVRSDGEVLINGEAKSVHWLQQGDRIQISDSQAVEVIQLGTVANTNESFEEGTAVSEATVDAPYQEATPAAELATETEVECTQSSTETHAEAGVVAATAAAAAVSVAATANVAGDRIDFMSQMIEDECAAEENSFSDVSTDVPFAALGSDDQNEASVETSSEPVGDASSADEGVSQRFESLETSVNQLHDQSANVDRRFDRLEDSLNALTEHLERLTASSLSADSVSPSPTESAGFVAEPAAVEPAPEVVQTPEPTTAGENYESSIASLFSELASDGPATTPAYQPATEAVSQTSGFAEAESSQVPGAFDQLSSEQPAVTQYDIPVMDPEASEASSDLSSSESESETEEPVGGFTERMMASMHSDSPTLSGEELANVVGLGVPKPEDTSDASYDAADALAALSHAETPAEPATEEPIGGFTERMMASMHSDSPTLSGEELANVVGLGVPKPEDTPDTTEAPAEAPAALPRAEVRTESVAEIFARLHSGSAATDGFDEQEVAAAPLRQTVQTTFEDIQASVTAALDADIPQTPEAFGAVEPNESVQSFDEPVQVADEPAQMADEPAQVADEGGSIMDKFRASLEAEGQTSEQAEAPEVEGEKQDSVEDYMSMLMSRMNGDSSDSDVGAPSEATEVQPTESGLLEEQAIETMLTEEEFTPRRKAAPIKSLDKMRELANSTSRSAVERSEKALQVERKKSLVLQALALGSLLLAAVMIAAKSYIFGGAFALIFFVTSAYFLYDTVSPSGGKEHATAKKTAKTSAPTPTPTPEAEVEEAE